VWGGEGGGQDVLLVLEERRFVFGMCGCAHGICGELLCKVMRGVVRFGRLTSNAALRGPAAARKERMNTAKLISPIKYTNSTLLANWSARRYLDLHVPPVPWWGTGGEGGRTSLLLARARRLQ
jgi:hypothetical protein